MKSLSTILCFLLLGHFATAQTLICPSVITTDSVQISNVQYEIETIEPGQTSGPLIPAPMTGLCINVDNLPPVSAGGTYRVYPQKEEQPRNGVTTLDIVYTNRHILNFQTLDLYQQLAADVDSNQIIDINDVSLMMKLILYLITDFPVPSWQFVDAAVMPTTLLDLQKNYIEFDPLNAPTTMTFYGVKSGDINGNSVPFTGNGHEASDRSSGELVFQVEDRMVKAGESISVDFLAKNFDDLVGYQFTLNFDEESLRFLEQKDVALANTLHMPLWNLEEAMQGTLPNLWLDEPESTQFQDGTVLFNVTFEVLQDGRLSDLLSAGSDITPNTAYQNSTGEVLEVTLDFGLTTSLQETPHKSFQLFQNQPNPVVQSTTIPFQLEKASDISLVITDALGRQVKTVQSQGIAGPQTIELDRSDFGAPGLYHYTLITESGQSSQVLLVK